MGKGECKEGFYGIGFELKVLVWIYIKKKYIYRRFFIFLVVIIERV